MGRRATLAVRAAKAARRGRIGASGAAGSPNQAGSAPAGGAGGDGSRSRTTCTSPTTDPTTGLVTCKEGYRHRPQALACALTTSPGAGGSDDASQLPRARDTSIACGNSSGGAGGGGAGGQAEDCDAFYLGYCDAFAGRPSFCSSGCVTDQDCGPASICVCGHEESPSGGVCVPSNCTTDADCGTGLLCASYNDACGSVSFACQTDQDECMADKDCESGPCELGETGVGTGAHQALRLCDEGQCGRPFLVEAVARLAPVTRGGDWNEPNASAPNLEHLSVTERFALSGALDAAGPNGTCVDRRVRAF